jgi:hypothetical protein
MPSRNRQGITENAGGQVVCPVCRETRLWLVWVTYRSPLETLIVHTDQAKIIHQTERGQGGGPQHVSILWRCRTGHEFSVEMDYRPDQDEPGLGSAAFGTAWEEGDEDAGA